MPSEVIPYLLTALGFLAVHVLNGIKSEIKDVKMTVAKIETDLRSGVTGLERRVSVIEAKCNFHHLQD